MFLLIEFYMWMKGLFSRLHFPHYWYYYAYDIFTRVQRRENITYVYSTRRLKGERKKRGIQETASLFIFLFFFQTEHCEMYIFSISGGDLLL